jgi:hypothetical protein
MQYEAPFGHHDATDCRSIYLRSRKLQSNPRLGVLKVSVSVNAYEQGHNEETQGTMRWSRSKTLKKQWGY